MFGLTPFETLMAIWLAISVGARFVEWVFQREVVTKGEWSAGRVKDLDEAKHYTRNAVNTYVPRELYDRDWKETNRRLSHLERAEASTS